MKLLLTIIIFLFFGNCFSQVITNSGSVVNISSGTILTGSSLNNLSGTVTNNGTLTLSSYYNNAATINGDGDYFVGGNGINTGTFTAGLGTVTFNGSGAQTLGSTTFSNVTFTGGSTKTLIGNINVTGALTIGANTTLALSNYNITLKSSLATTARIAAVPTTASVTYGTGKFVIERYIPGRRKYRLITSAVTTSTSSSLTTGQESLSIWGNWQNSGGSTASAGTFITGGTSADGFDQQTTNASLFSYDATGRSYTGFTSANGKNTKYTPLKAGVAYYMFVYGDRTNTIYTSTPSYTVLTSSGTIITGDQTYTTSSAIPLNGGSGKYTLLGNPFASPIDWATVQKTNLSNTFWGWDPNLNSTGGYVTVNTTGTIILISPYSGSTGLNQYIQSGQGFFVQATSASPTLMIREQDKVSNNNTYAFRTATPNNISLIAINLLYDNNVLADGAVAAFDTGFSNSVSNEDASKIMNAAENVAIEEGTSMLSIDARQMPALDDTLFLHLSNLKKTQYILQIFSKKLNANIEAYVEDKFLKTYTALNLNDTNRIAFNITSDAASVDANRFRIVFSKPAGIQTNSSVAKSEIKVFPNPIKERQINFELTNAEKGEYYITLQNSQGQQIVKQVYQYDGSSGIQTISLTNKLPGGIYYLQVANKSHTFTKTIMAE